jgi:hypothetical protein
MVEIFSYKADLVYLKSDAIKQKTHNPLDIHAFLLLRALVQSHNNIINEAVHDTIWLDVDTDHLALVITEKQIDELVRCGVMYDPDADSLFMFV